MGTQDIHKKHESDLTKEEKWQLEKEKLEGMDWKHKLNYIWDYYKPQIFGVIAVILAIWGGFSWYENSKYETILYAVAVDGYMEGSEEKQMEEEFRSYIDDTEKYHKIIVDTTIALGAEDSTLAMNSELKMTTIVAAGEADVTIGPEKQMDQFIAQELALNLEEVLSEDVLAKYGDKIVDGVKLDVTGNKKVAERMRVKDEPTYLILMSNGKNQKTAAKFVEYLMEE